jgi:hypothetical protein
MSRRAFTHGAALLARGPLRAGARRHALKAGSGACPSSPRPLLASGLFTKAELGPTQQPRVPVDVVIGLGLQSRSLEAVAPAVAAQWHPTKNGTTTPADVAANSHKKFWFTCDAGADHEWEATLSSRVSSGTGCPCCAGRKLSVTNSLATVAPEVAAQWHPTKNGDTTPADVVANSRKKYWFTCNAGPDHEWEATLSNRVSGGNGCPCCAGRKVSVTNSLASLKPAAAAMWDHEANGPLTPSDVVAASYTVYGFVDGGGRPFERALRSFKEQ